jgi:DNA-binding NarL/FixJ family response regulator
MVGALLLRLTTGLPLQTIVVIIRDAVSVRTKTLSPRTRAQLLIVDNSAVCREGIRAIIGRDRRFGLCDPAPHKEGVVDLVKRHNPGLILIEPFGPGRDGVMLIKELAARFPQTRILAVSQHPEEIYAERILRAGASGYWMKSGASEELIRAIETVLSGELYLSPRMAFLAIRELVASSHGKRSPIGGLSDRELHIFGLIGAGHGAGRIAEELGISRKTVETHQGNIKIKLSYRDARELREGARHWFDSLRA